MLTWLTVTALVVGSLYPRGAALSVAPTCRVKGRPEAQLTLYCGDGANSGVVQYWHTPFGELRGPGFPSGLDPVFMHGDGRLVIPSSSALHSGLYYCLLQHPEGTTLWPYELHVDHNPGRNQAQEPEQSSRCGPSRLSRDVGPMEEKQGSVSTQQLAGAVAASVLLTFVLGFSVGALSRSHVLRCLEALAKRFRFSRQRTDAVDTSSEFTMTTVPPTSQEDESVNRPSVDSTASSPPTKPQRSFRDKREEKPETPAHLKTNEEEERDKMCEENEEEDEILERGNITFTMEVEEKDEGHNMKEHEEQQEEEGEDVEEKRSKDEEAPGGRKEKSEDKEEEDDDTDSSTHTEDDETEEDRRKGGERPSSPPRRRVIRLYQYDEDGHRYSHLPDPAPTPTPTPRTRTRSLTRLSAIMAAASAGPLDRQETGREEDKTHMDI